MSRSVSSPAAGLFHTRGGPLALICLTAALILTVAFPELSYPVRNVVENPARGIGTPEIIAILLSSVLPAITVPRFDARELHAHTAARLAHLAYTTAVLAAPLAIIPLWYATVVITHPHARLPPMTGLIGNIAVFSCLATLLCLTLGPLASGLLTGPLFAGFVLLQQAYPASFLATNFATGKEWHTNYWITAIAALLTLAISWHYRAIPRTARR